MRAKLAIVIAGAGLMMSAAPAFAHHSFAAEFDVDKPVELKGVITKWEWINPHSRVFIDVKDANGKVTNWNVELLSPNTLTRAGWTRHTLKEGDVITVKGSRAKDGSNIANAKTVILADGKLAFDRSTNGDDSITEGVERRR
jgi:hypothetical protein